MLIIMAGALKSPQDSEIATRLITLRRIYAGDNQTIFAKKIDIDVKRWNNFERGLPLSKEVAFRLVERIPGLTLDWLWLGIESGLPLQLQRELAEAGNGTTAGTPLMDRRTSR
jgi:hypothetical protein